MSWRHYKTAKRLWGFGFGRDALGGWWIQVWRRVFTTTADPWDT